MILESFDKFEYKLLECNGCSPSQIIKKLNEAGNEGWESIYVYGDLFKAYGDASILLKRKITCTKVDKL